MDNTMDDIVGGKIGVEDKDKTPWEEVVDTPLLHSTDAVAAEVGLDIAAVVVAAAVVLVVQRKNPVAVASIVFVKMSDSALAVVAAFVFA